MVFVSSFWSLCELKVEVCSLFSRVEVELKIKYVKLEIIEKITYFFSEIEKVIYFSFFVFKMIGGVFCFINFFYKVFGMEMFLVCKFLRKFISRFFENVFEC